MPKETFFRLPTEKRERIMDAANQEFLKTPYKDLSINQIIKAADIPRGSFYQYFEDKDDLFLYIIREKQEQFVQLVNRELDRLDGDFIQMLLNFIERGKQYLSKCDSCSTSIPSLSDQQSLHIILGIVDNDKVFGHLEKRLNKCLLEKGDFQNICVSDNERGLYLDMIENIVGGCLKKLIQSPDVETRLAVLDDLKKKMLLLRRAFTNHSVVNIS